MARNSSILLVSILVMLLGMYLIYEFCHRENLSYYVMGVLLVGSMGLTHVTERYCRSKKVKGSDHRVFWPALWLLIFIPSFFYASALNFERNEELLEQEVFEVNARVSNIYQSKGRSTHTWYYVYTYVVNNESYTDRGMLEYNPVQVGDNIKLVVSVKDHSVHREAMFFNLTSD
ncbi:hypothetical protein [Shewanella atlantica]|uniref:hypothetical protein n=1 Tax=Shewanella atlantica TaxID=271099 RepID=UPI00373678FC